MATIPAALCRIYRNNFKRHYLRTKTFFLDLLLHFGNVHEICSIFKKRMSILAQSFPKFSMLKDVATETSKRSCFGTPFAQERVNGFQTLLKSTWHHYYPLFSSIQGKLNWKKSPAVWYEILRLFVNALTTDHKYSGSNIQNFSQQFQTPLSQKQKTLSRFFIGFLKCASKKRWLS